METEARTLTLTMTESALARVMVMSWEIKETEATMVAMERVGGRVVASNNNNNSSRSHSRDHRRHTDCPCHE